MMWWHIGTKVAEQIIPFTNNLFAPYIYFINTCTVHTHIITNNIVVNCYCCVVVHIYIFIFNNTIIKYDTTYIDICYSLLLHTHCMHNMSKEWWQRVTSSRITWPLGACKQTLHLYAYYILTDIIWTKAEAWEQKQFELQYYCVFIFLWG